MAKIKACLVSELVPGTMRTFNILGRTILIANVNGRFFAMDGLCSHEGGILADGSLKGYTITCPLHGAEYDLRTGKVIQEPMGEDKKVFDLRSYQVTLEEGCVHIDML